MDGRGQKKCFSFIQQTNNKQTTTTKKRGDRLRSTKKIAIETRRNVTNVGIITFVVLTKQTKQNQTSKNQVPLYI